MFEKLKELICNYVEADADSITEDTRFADDLGFNSFDFVAMLGDIEVDCDIEIDEGKASACRTVGELIKYLEGCK